MPALSPTKIAKKHLASIPEVVFEAVNELLAKKGAGGSVTIGQDELLNLLAKKAPEIKRGTYFDNGWLDFEAKYRAQGWKVEYDKPAYCETYEASWSFTPRRGRR